MQMNFTKLQQRIDPSVLLKQIEDQPFLWDKNPCRLSTKGPHHETQDMFLRYRDETKFRESGDWSGFADAHFDDWNKTIDYLPEAKRITMGLMGLLQGEVLGGVFLYKVQPGKQIYPHVDKGWHPDFYQKFNVCLQSNPEAAFCYKEDQMVQEAGDIHFFRNDILHWVVNNGNTDHIVLTVCIRLDSGFRAPWSPEGWTAK
jgi:Aspartyl/Asparaginyl beta-hydroxylase